MTNELLRLLAMVVAVTGGMAVGYWRGRVSMRMPRVRLVPPKVGTSETLRLFVANPSFTTEEFMVLDRDGRWTTDMIEDFAEAHDEKAGLWVWEGTAAARADAWRFTGERRVPTPEEMALLAAGKFPLRGHPFPEEGALEEFSVPTVGT